MKYIIRYWITAIAQLFSWFSPTRSVCYVIPQVAQGQHVSECNRQFNPN